MNLAILPNFIFSLSGILIVFTCLTLVIILIKHGGTKLHFIWLLFNFCLILLGLAFFNAGLTKDSTSALFWFRFSHIGITLLPSLLFHCICLLCEIKRKFILFLIYTQSIFFWFVNLTSDSLFNGVKLLVGSLYWATPGNLYHWYVGLFILITIYSFYELFQAFKYSEGNKKTQIYYFTFSMLIGYIGGLPNYLPAYGIRFYPWGNYLIPIYASIGTYAILKHKLLDIVVVIKKGVIYSLLIGCITLFYLFLILTSEKILQGLIGYKSLFISIIFSLFIAVFFIPIKNRIQLFVDTFFFKGSPETIAQENELLRKEVANTEKSKAVANLASGIAHEIKNPLTAIKTFLDYFPEKKNDPAFLEKFQDIASKEIRRVENLVSELLEFAKPSPLQLQETNIAHVINSSLSLLESQIKQHKIQVTKDFNVDGQLSIKADPNKLKQALINIFLNAIEAMTNGGTLTVSADLRSSANSSVVIGVADTGTGIDKKDLPHIFEPFFTKKEKGTGLGLAITRGIIEEHKGKIRVESVISVGTKFIIELPLNTDSHR